MICTIKFFIISHWFLELELEIKNKYFDSIWYNLQVNTADIDPFWKQTILEQTRLLPIEAIRVLD